MDWISDGMLPRMSSGPPVDLPGSVIGDKPAFARIASTISLSAMGEWPWLTDCRSFCMRPDHDESASPAARACAARLSQFRWARTRSDLAIYQGPVNGFAP